jgi:hypothetical protein
VNVGLIGEVGTPPVPSKENSALERDIPGSSTVLVVVFVGNNTRRGFEMDSRE